MSTFKVIITDDESGARKVLSSLISDFFPDLEIVALCEDLPACIRAIKTHKPDLVFLDIEMPGYSGLEIYQFLNPEEISFELIFCTAYQNYAIDAFRLAAIDYLLKPIQLSQLTESIERFRNEKDKHTALEQLQLFKSNLSGQEEKKICISTSEGKYYIPFNELIALEADGSYTHIHTQNNGKIYASRRLKIFEEMLGGDTRFLRTHRSNLINKSFIEKLTKEDDPKVHLKTGHVFPIASDKMKDIELALQ